MLNAFRKKLRAEDLMEIRNKKGQQLSKKRGRKSVDIFRVGDPVRVQEMDKKGKITEIRSFEDGSQSSFTVKKNNGRYTLRHKSHVRHDITIEDRAVPCRVAFQEEPQIRPLNI